MADENVTEETAYDDINKISFKYEGTEYIMEFDRDTVSRVEKTFDITTADVVAGKYTAFYGLFYGALLKHHPKIKPATVENFIKLFPDKAGVYRALASMYNKCINTLLEEPDEGNAISWKVM